MDNIKLPEQHTGKAQNQGTRAIFGTVHIYIGKYKQQYKTANYRIVARQYTLEAPFVSGM
jgi:hypothetical protein